MPKQRLTARVLRRTEPTRTNRDVIQRQLTCIQRGKENSLKPIGESTHTDPLLTYMKIEVKEEELDNSETLELGDEISVPLKIEQIETLEYDSIKQEQSSEPDISTSQDGNKELNILIEWALNLQFDHSKQCSGRLYPCKELLDNFRCKIVVLYCTVCKKRMLHTLKDWAMF